MHGCPNTHLKGFQTSEYVLLPICAHIVTTLMRCLAYSVLLLLHSQLLFLMKHAGMLA